MSLRTLLSVLLLSGCATTSIVTPPPVITVPPPSMVAPPVDADGGFTYGGRSLYSRRAREVGDVVTIRVAHRTSARTVANTKLNREGSTELKVGAMFGLDLAVNRIPGLSADAGPSLGLSTGSSNDFTGAGDTDRNGTVTATMTARVVEVLPNGSLRLYASQQVRVNNEVQGLVVEGIVDPRAIGADNSVPSSALVDLRIEYAGVGLVSDKQRPGWFARIFDYVNPF
jgi:flagellar L-ring protein precursor FlgH